MKKQIDGQLNLFDYISEEDKNILEGKFYEIPLSSYDGSEDKIPISIYGECTVCWCSTCRHNKKGEAVPRDFAGEKKPCPSCDFCIEQKKADICEIGSYENGCKLRAEEEGISVT